MKKITANAVHDIKEFLIAYERELWESVKNADFDYEDNIRAKARWSTAHKILQQVLTITNKTNKNGNESNKNRRPL